MPDERSTSDTPARPTLAAVGRGLALFLGSFTLLNILGDFLTPGFDANNWWIAVPVLRHWAAEPFLLLAALALLTIAFANRQPAWLRRVTGGFVVLLILATLYNALTFYAVRASGELKGSFALPLSLFLAAALLLVFVTACRRGPLSRRGWFVFVLTFAASAVLFPLAQMVCFGKTDYRRKADAIVVLGARVYRDGTMSQALADRTRTGVELYHAGYARTLIFSGGPGDGSIDEPTAMKNFAIANGVPDTAIILDPDGLNTDATVRNTVPMLQQRGLSGVLIVSHFYHLPRTKMTYERAIALADGDKPAIRVYTVPAKETYTLSALPQYMAREVVALWAYYLSPLAGEGARR